MEGVPLPRADHRPLRRGHPPDWPAGRQRAWGAAGNDPPHRPGPRPRRLADGSPPGRPAAVPAGLRVAGAPEGLLGGQERGGAVAGPQRPAAGGGQRQAGPPERRGQHGGRWDRWSRPAGRADGSRHGGRRCLRPDSAVRPQAPQGGGGARSDHGRRAGRA